MRINSSGNVGIGTTNPQSQLHIFKSNSGGIGGELRLDNNNSAVANKTRIVFDDGNGSSTSSERAAIVCETEASPYMGQLQFQTGVGTLSTKMLITGSGNVGIGTTSPVTKLDVAAGWITVDNGYGVAFGSGGATPDDYFKLNDTASGSLINLVQDGTSRFNIEGVTGDAYIQGSTGIGTQTPATKLHVVGTAETRLRVGSSNASSNVVLELRDENTPTGQGTVVTYNNATGETYFNNAMSTATTDFHFQSGEYGTANDFFTLSNSGGNAILHLKTTGGDSFITYENATNELAVASDGDLRLTTPTDQDVFFISSGGNIDMTQAGGTVDMGGDLVVDGAVTLGNYASGLLEVDANGVVSVDTNNSTDVTLDTSVYDYLSLSGQEIRLNQINYTTDISNLPTLGTAASTASTDYATAAQGTTADAALPKAGGTMTGNLIVSGSNIGIGTTSPQQALHIKGATNGLMMLEGDNDNGLAGCYYKTEDTDNTMNRTKGFFGFRGNHGYGLGYFTMWLDNVGDNGTVTSSEERFRWERDGDFHADGDVIAYSTTTPSDIRLKTDVETIESASEKVSKLRGVEYTWSKGKLAGQREIGLIAQEVEAVVPEVVKEKELPLWDNSGESYKTVDYEKLVALLIESNKELQQRVELLEQKLKQ